MNMQAEKPDDARIIFEIADRAHRLVPKLSKLAVSMDLTACHLNGCPLRLVDLLEATDFDFMHDVLGIRANLDRETGTLDGCFLPRFARPNGGDR